MFPCCKVWILERNELSCVTSVEMEIVDSMISLSACSGAFVGPSFRLESRIIIINEHVESMFLEVAKRDDDEFCATVTEEIRKKNEGMGSWRKSFLTDCLRVESNFNISYSYRPMSVDSEERIKIM